MSSLVKEFKCSKVKLKITLSEVRDPVVTQTAPILSAGKVVFICCFTAGKGYSWGEEAWEHKKTDHTDIKQPLRVQQLDIGKNTSSGADIKAPKGSFTGKAGLIGQSGRRFKN